MKYNGRPALKISNGCPILFGRGLPQPFHRHTQAMLLNDPGNTNGPETTGNCPGLPLRTISVVQAV